ncbi:MAG: hypothetical protein ACXWLR_01460 [Myxococcales bacterium]
MAAGETPTNALSLEQILWRAMDRWREEPALVDAEEFAQHIAQAFGAELPEEAFADRFFADADRLHRASTLADAVVRAAPRRLHVYEFDLNRLEYVIVEDDDGVVVVSEFGQFKLESDDALGRALEAAVVKKPPTEGEPRAYLVRASGELVTVDAGKVARALERETVRQVSMPAVAAPGRRLAPFSPVRREMSEERERRALQQDEALSAAVREAWAALPGIGSAARWEQMLGRRGQPEQRSVVVQTGNVLAIVAGTPREFAGERALARSEMLAAVRAGDAPVQALGGTGAAEILARRTEPTPGGDGDPFWIQPERAFLPDITAGERTLVARPLRLGEITGDPWADWALAVSASGGEPARRATATRGAAPEAALSSHRRELQFAGAPVVAFRAPDGALIFNRPAEPIRLAVFGRPAAPISLRRRAEVAPRAGAVPFTALRALHAALERTAAAGAYRMPAARIESALDAIGTGRALALGPGDERRRAVRLAAPVTASVHAARLVISLPFPNRGQLHVGQDLSDALQAYLAAPLVPRVEAGPAPRPGGALALRPGPLRGQAGRIAAVAAPGSDRAVPRAPLAGARSISNLPLLLQHAVAGSGSWTAGPGAALPLVVRGVEEGSPFTAAAEAAAYPPRRPPGPGEEEIVIPLPLWAQMGRGAISDTDVLLSSPAAAGGYAPPLGPYRLVAHGEGALDLTGGAPARERGVVELSGPTALRLSQRPTGGVSAMTPGGSQMLARVPMDEGERISVRAPGAPGEGTDLAPLVPSLRDWSAPDAPPVAPAAGAFAPQSIPFSRATVSPARAATLATGTSAREGIAVEPRPEEPPMATGLPPGSWSGHRPGAAPGDQRWVYGARPPDAPQDVGGIVLGGLSRPGRRQLPVGLRFRYVGAPLWWSGSTRSGAMASDGGDEGEDSSPATRAMRAGLRAATSAASIWRSILVAGPRWGGPADDLSGGMDSGRDANADQMSSLARGFDALTAGTLVGAGAVSGAAAGAGYVAVTGSGAAGTVSKSAAARARADSVEMSIVAAIPPAPPPLESMGSGPTGGDAPHARGKGHGHAAHKGKEDSDAVSHSKIEGSVDAIAQRIYHRIRRRIQSDRERFGG